MADWGHKTRFSLAAFHSLGELDAAVSALSAAGFSRDQIGLAATETSIEQQKKKVSGSDGVTASQELTDLIGRFEPTAHHVAGVRIMVSEGTPGQFAGCFAAQDGGGPSSGLMAATRAKLLSQLYSGAWLLGTNAQSYEQLRAGTRILLAHSSEPCRNVRTARL